jgi:hypothetical protein
MPKATDLRETRQIIRASLREWSAESGLPVHRLSRLERNLLALNFDETQQAERALKRLLRRQMESLDSCRERLGMTPIN